MIQTALQFSQLKLIKKKKRKSQSELLKPRTTEDNNSKMSINSCFFFSARQRPTWWSRPTDGLVELSHFDCWLDRHDWNSRTGALLPCFFQRRHLHGHLLHLHQEVSAEGVKAAPQQKGAPNHEGAPPWLKPAENSGNNLKRKKKKKSPQQGYSREEPQHNR